MSQLTLPPPRSLVTASEQYIGNNSLEDHILVKKYLPVTDLTGAGEKYTAVAAIKAENQANVALRLVDDDDCEEMVVNSSGEWEVATVTKEFDSDSTERQIEIAYSGTVIPSGDFWIDGVYLYSGDVYTPASQCTFDVSDLGLEAGQDLSLVFAVKTDWAGDDGCEHRILDMSDGTDGIYITKTSDNYLKLATLSSGDEQSIALAVDSINWASGDTKVIIATLDESNNQQLFLDTVSGDTAVGDYDRETSFNELAYVGTIYSGGSTWDGYSLNGSFNGAILFAAYEKVLSNYEVTKLFEASDFFDGVLEGGQSTWNVHASGLSNGLYILKFRATDDIGNTTAAEDYKIEAFVINVS